MNRLEAIEARLRDTREWLELQPDGPNKEPQDVTDLRLLLAVARAASTPPQDRPWLTQYRQDIEDALKPLLEDSDD